MADDSHILHPYPGPRPFTEQDRGSFFGRTDEIEDLTSLVIARRVVLLYAQSGAGKTSLVRAGLVPRLQEFGFQVLPTARVGGAAPNVRDPEQIANAFVFAAITSWTEKASTPDALVATTIAEYLKNYPRPTGPDGETMPRAVIFDQAEELFTMHQHRWRDREGFFRQLDECLEADAALRVVLVIREDFLAQLDPFTSMLADGDWLRYRLERLDGEAALLAIRKPLEGTPRTFAEGVAEALVAELLKERVEGPDRQVLEVEGDFVEPVQLQVVCFNLWENLPPDVQQITLAHLAQFGSVSRALSSFYERVVHDTARATRVSEQRLRWWFGHELITAGGTRGVAYRGATHTAGLPNAAADELERHHLVRVEVRAGARWYELTHDRFIQPIQDSNAAWERSRRINRVKIGGAGVATAAALVLAAVVLAISRQQQTIAEQQLKLDVYTQLDLEAPLTGSLLLLAPTSVATRASTANAASPGVPRTPSASPAPSPPAATRTSAPSASQLPTAQPTARPVTGTPVPPPTPTVVATPDRGPRQEPIGDSVANVEILGTTIGGGPGRVGVVGSLHGGRERAAFDFLSGLVEALARGDEVLHIPDSLALTIVPTLNPDDIDRASGFNNNGVDLNRNFPVRWVPTACGPKTGRYAPFGGCRRNAGGTAPFSEPESQAVKDLVEQQQLAALIIVNSGLTDVSSRNGGGGAGEPLAMRISAQFPPIRYQRACCLDYPVTGQLVDWVESIDVLGLELNPPDDLLEQRGIPLMQFIVDDLANTPRVTRPQARP